LHDTGQFAHQVAEQIRATWMRNRLGGAVHRLRGIAPTRNARSAESTCGSGHLESLWRGGLEWGGIAASIPRRYIPEAKPRHAYPPTTKRAVPDVGALPGAVTFQPAAPVVPVIPDPDLNQSSEYATL
jgi:hypothetical protein